MTVVNEAGVPILGEDNTEEPRFLDVCVVSHDMVHASFAHDLGQLMGLTAAHLPAGVSLRLNFVPGTLVNRARQQLMARMKEDGVTYTLWLDSDMRFPADTFLRLIEHRQPVVGINYSKRAVPPNYVAIKKLSEVRGVPSERLVTDEASTGLEEVDAIGFGGLLIRGDVIAALPPLDEAPWFDMPWSTEKLTWMGEDVHFCKLVREKLNTRILVDHDLSKECAHTGLFEFRLEHVDALEALEEAEA